MNLVSLDGRMIAASSDRVAASELFANFCASHSRRPASAFHTRSSEAASGPLNPLKIAQVSGSLLSTRIHGGELTVSPLHLPGQLKWRSGVPCGPHARSANPLSELALGKLHGVRRAPI